MSELKGLVLCGGQSKRMGRDKSWLQYHDTPQSLHTFELLKTVCKQVFVSIHAGQQMPPELSRFLIQDDYLQIGPAGGILSAHNRFSDCAWLVMACDMPFVEAEDLRLLVHSRGEEFAAFKAERIETLPSIWEASALKMLEMNVSRKEYSLTRTLQKLRGNLLPPRHGSKLQNINEPETRHV